MMRDPRKRVARDSYVWKVSLQFLGLAGTQQWTGTYVGHKQIRSKGFT